jgi:hypothetical protein
MPGPWMDDTGREGTMRLLHVQEGEQMSFNIKSRVIYCCIWCGLRPGLAKSAFCARDVKRFGIKLVDERHRTHLFQRARQVTNWYGHSLLEKFLNL